MNMYYNVVINAVGFLILIILLFTDRKRIIKKTPDQKIYGVLIFIIILMLIVDSICWLVDGLQGKNGFQINFYANFVLYLFSPINAILWTCYADYKIFQDEKGLKKRAWIYLIPFLINSVFCIVQLFTPFLFEIQEGNIFHRLPGAYLVFAVPFIYFIYTTILVGVNKNKITKRTFNPLLLYIIIPGVCCILQAFLYGLSLIYIGICLSMLIVYLRVQNDSGLVDHLTNLNNRRFLEEYVKSEINHLHNESIYGIMIDIDRFKIINDTYGHLAGDKALEVISKIFLKSTKYGDFVARYAGDEFIIIIKTNDDNEPINLIKTIQNRIDEYNEASGNPYKLCFSAGYACYCPGDSYDEFINKIDKEMYKVKDSKRKNELLL